MLKMYYLPTVTTKIKDKKAIDLNFIIYQQ